MDNADILINIRKIVRTINIESKRIEQEHGISIPQLLCLKFLSEQKGFQASHKVIKDFLQLNASTTTGIIHRLEKKGLLAKLPKGKDKRVTTVVLTASGAKLLKHTPEPLHEQLTVKLHNLSPEQLQKIQQSFQIIIDLLDISESDTAPIITAEMNIAETPTETND